MKKVLLIMVLFLMGTTAYGANESDIKQELKARFVSKQLTVLQSQINAQASLNISPCGHLTMYAKACGKWTHDVMFFPPYARHYKKVGLHGKIISYTPFLCSFMAFAMAGPDRYKEYLRQSQNLINLKGKAEALRTITPLSTSVDWMLFDGYDTACDLLMNKFCRQT